MVQHFNQTQKDTFKFRETFIGHMKLEVLVIDQSFEGKNVILIEGDSQHLNYFIKSLA